MVGYLTPLSIPWSLWEALPQPSHWPYILALPWGNQSTPPADFLFVCTCRHMKTRVDIVFLNFFYLIICVFVVFVCANEHTYRDQRKMLSDQSHSALVHGDRVSDELKHSISVTLAGQQAPVVCLSLPLPSPGSHRNVQPSMPVFM